MITLFTPFEYSISAPEPEEISTIRKSSIEKYFVNRLKRSEYILSAEGYFRFKARNKSTEHNEYVNKKTMAMYDSVKTLCLDCEIIRIDYFLDSKLTVGVYVENISKLMIGCVMGINSENMTEEEFQKIWYGSSTPL